MPSFVSKGGVWEPAKERAFDPKSGEIYDGPDREAKRYIEENGGAVGMDILDDPQLIEIAESRRMTVQQYVEKFSPKPDQIKAKKEADEKIVTHALPTPKPGVSDGQIGGFYDPSSETPEEVMASKKRGHTK